MAATLRGDVFLKQEVSNMLLSLAAKESLVLKYARHMNMPGNATTFPVVNSLPTATFPDGDTGMKTTSKMTWRDVDIKSKVVAVILPYPEEVRDDVDFDLEGTLQTGGITAIAEAIDNAILFGYNKPAAWPTALVPGAIAAGNIVAAGANTADAGGIYGDFDDIAAFLENGGNRATRIIADLPVRGRLRKARDLNGVRLAGFSLDEIEGVGVDYQQDLQWPTGIEAVAVDFSKVMIGDRTGMKIKKLDQASLYDAEGEVEWALAQQDMEAIRLSFRLGYAIPNTRLQGQSTSFPAAVLTGEGYTPPGGGSGGSGSGGSGGA